MLTSEKLAIAAHLHVLLRRKTGRVTDTEWMASNTEYAAEIARFARESARKDGHADLAEWADKLEAAMTEVPEQPLAARLLASAAAAAPKPAKEAPADAPATDANAPRYIRGIR